MARQEDVIRAFLDGANEPWRASNFQMETIGDNGSIAYLTGGGTGGPVVFAVREPINRVTVYGNRIRWSNFRANGDGNDDRPDISWYGVRDQHRLVQRQFRRYANRNGIPDGYASINSMPKPRSNIDELE